VIVALRARMRVVSRRVNVVDRLGAHCSSRSE